MRQKGINMKSFLVFTFCVLAAFLIGCEQDLVGPTSVQTDPVNPDQLVASMTYNGGFGQHTVSGSVRIDSCRKGINIVFIGSSNQEDSIVDRCWYFNYTDSVHEQSAIREFNNVGEDNYIEYKVWKLNGQTSSSILILRPVNYYGAGGTGEISFLSPTTLFNNGMRKISLALPESRIFGLLMNRAVTGPVTNWKYWPQTNLQPQRIIYTDTVYDGFYSEFNYVGNIADSNWSDAQGSAYEVENNLYGIVYYGDAIFPAGSAPVYQVPGIGDSLLSIVIINDSVICYLNNKKINGIEKKVTKKPWIKTKVTNANWSTGRNQVLQSSSGWGKGGIKVSSINPSDHLVYVKYGIDNLEADYSQCFAYHQNDQCLVFAYVGGDIPYFTPVKAGVDPKDMPRLYPHLIRYLEKF